MKNNSEIISCKQCRIPKLADADYYNWDGYISQPCKECRRINQRNKKGHIPQSSKSTALVVNKLSELGIPSQINFVRNDKRIDLLAWGCVAIECKRAKANRTLDFHFTTLQKKDLSAYGELLICVVGNENRFFVLPMYLAALKLNGKNVLCVTLSSNHGNSKSAEWFLEYENRFDLIESERLIRSNELKSIARTIHD